MATGGLTKRYPPGTGLCPKDVALLAETDVLHDTLSGPATQHLMQRALLVFGDTRTARLASISVAHLYPLQGAAGYRCAPPRTNTSPTGIAIGDREAPQPDGRPGSLRIESVHQRDEGGRKGVYHINALDCVTQWEIVPLASGSPRPILLPVIKAIREGFPFTISDFHADNGSEYINHRIARLLEKHGARAPGRGRPRRCGMTGA